LVLSTDNGKVLQWTKHEPILSLKSRLSLVAFYCQKYNGYDSQRLQVVKVPRGKECRASYVKMSIKN